MSRFVASLFVIVLLGSISSADTWKLGAMVYTHHGCASPKAARALNDFIAKDPTFAMKPDAAVLSISTPTKDGKGVHEKSWNASTVAGDGIAEWAMPENDERQQIRILVNSTVFMWSSDGKQPRMKVSLVLDYDPEQHHTHENVCAEVWVGQAVRL